MLIVDLGLRPCLIESLPISASDQLKAINKAERKIAVSNYLKARKKKLKAKLATTGTEI